MAEGDLPMRKRYFVKGMCPVLSCVTMLADFLGSGVMSFINAAFGEDGSARFMVLYRGDASCVSSYIFLWNARLAADLLCGRSFVSSLGSLLVGELP